MAAIDPQEPELPLANGHDEDAAAEAGAETVDASPFTLGKDAGLAGGEQQCPYELDSEDYASWMDGYRAGAAERATAGDGGDSQLGYNLGYEDGRTGRQMKFCPFTEGSPERDRYEAGWYQAQLDGMEGSGEKPAAQEKVAEHFRAMGKAAAAAGNARDLGAQAGREGADRSTNPFAEGTPEHDAWLAGWIAPDPGAGHPEPETAPRRRGRPRREPPADQLGA